MVLTGKNRQDSVAKSNCCAILMFAFNLNCRITERGVEEDRSSDSCLRMLQEEHKNSNSQNVLHLLVVWNKIELGSSVYISW